MWIRKNRVDHMGSTHPCFSGSKIAWAIHDRQLDTPGYQAESHT